MTQINEKTIVSFQFNPDLQLITSNLNIVSKKDWKNRPWYIKLLDFLTRNSLDPLKTLENVKSLINRVSQNTNVEIAAALKDNLRNLILLKGGISFMAHCPREKIKEVGKLMDQFIRDIDTTAVGRPIVINRRLTELDNQLTDLVDRFIQMSDPDDELFQLPPSGSIQ